jgi:hypothetical protein
MEDHLASAWFRTLIALKAKIRYLLDGFAPCVAPLPSTVGLCVSVWSGLVLLLGTCVGRHEMLPIPLRDAHLTFMP